MTNDSSSASEIAIGNKVITVAAVAAFSGRYKGRGFLMSGTIGIVTAIDRDDEIVPYEVDFDSIKRWVRATDIQRLNEDDLTSDEQLLIKAARTGNMTDAIHILSRIAKEKGPRS